MEHDLMATETTLLRLCVLRALDAASDGTVEWKPGIWTVMEASARGAKVAAFICLWATEMLSRGADRITIEDYATAGYDKRSTAYRRLTDFRTMFPEFNDPHELATMAIARSERKRDRLTPSLLVAV